MPNQITFGANIVPLTTPMEVSINGGTTFVTVPFTTVGSAQQSILSAVPAGTYAIGQLVLGAVGFPATRKSNGSSVTVLNGNTDYALLVVGDSTAAAGSPSYSLSPVLISEFNQGILNSGGTGSFTSTANTAVSGQSLNLNPDGTAGGMMGPLFASQVAGRYVAGKYNVLIIEGLLNTMSNDVFTNGEAGAATRVLGYLKQYIAQIRADNPNWRIITGSLTKRTNGASAAAIVSDENQRPILNQALVDGFAAGTLDVQAVARFGQDTRLGIPGPNTDGTATNWFTDWVHYTQQSVEQVVGPSFTGAFLFARFGTPQPLPYTGQPINTLYLNGYTPLPVLTKTANVVETAVGSGTYIVSPAGFYGDWRGYVVFNAQMPATGLSYMGFKRASQDAVNAIMGLTTSTALTAQGQTYDALLPSFYQHQDGRVLINETAPHCLYTTTTGGPTSYVLQTNEYLLLVKNNSALSLAKTTDGATYTTIYSFAGTYPNAMYVAASLEASVGKLYGPQGFSLTLGAAPAVGSYSGAVTFIDNISQVNTSGVITTTGLAAGAWGGTGRCTNLKLAAGTNGRLIMDFPQAIGAGYAILGLSDTNVRTPYTTTGFRVGMWVVNYQGVNYMHTVENAGAQIDPSPGTFTNTARIFSINRQGSVLTFEWSENAGSTWTPARTFTYSSAADLFILSDINQQGTMQNPRGTGLTPY